MASVTNLQQGAAPTEPIERDVDDAVRHHPFCAGLDDSSIHALLECASFKRYPAHEVIFSEGSEADRFYLVHKGQVELELFVPGSGVVQIQTVHEGEVFGASSLFGTNHWSFSAQSTQPSELVVLTANVLRQHAVEDPQFEHELMARLAPVLFHRLRATRQRLIEVYGSVE